jgi:hypothetical protein
MLIDQKPWPTREQWAADAEDYAQRWFYENDHSVSTAAVDYLERDDIKTLVYMLKECRLHMSRLLRALEDGKADLGDTGHLDRPMEYLTKVFKEAWERWEHARKAAEDAAVKAEVQRRNTDEAWAKELKRRESVEQYLTDPKARFTDMATTPPPQQPHHEEHAPEQLKFDF